VKIKDRDHISIIKRMLDSDDPTTRTVVEFIGRQAAAKSGAPASP
jgi:hypothetical protein